MLVIIWLIFVLHFGHRRPTNDPMNDTDHRHAPENCFPHDVPVGPAEPAAVPSQTLHWGRTLSPWRCHLQALWRRHLTRPRPSLATQRPWSAMRLTLQQPWALSRSRPHRALTRRLPWNVAASLHAEALRQSPACNPCGFYATDRLAVKI